MVLIVRSDLSPGYQAVQPAHALAEFAMTYPEIFADWHKNHKNLVILSVPSEAALQELFTIAQERGIKGVDFREPDINDELTAIALEPSDETYKLVSSLSLALKERQPVNERIVFHYNKAHNVDKTVPPWVVKHKGETHYVQHLSSRRGFETKETPDSDHTKGSIQFRGKLKIEDNVALIE